VIDIGGLPGGWPEWADAALELVPRTGARGLEIGYLDETPVSEDARWYASVRYQGVKISVEDQRGPAEAAHALALRLLTGAQCQGCGGLVALSDFGAVAYPTILIDGRRWEPEEAAAAGLCRWRLIGKRWEMGCKRSEG
jgi:hypothetical protein